MVYAGTKNDSTLTWAPDMQVLPLSEVDAERLEETLQSDPQRLADMLQEFLGAQPGLYAWSDHCGVRLACKSDFSKGVLDFLHWAYPQVAFGLSPLLMLSPDISPVFPAYSRVH